MADPNRTSLWAKAATISVGLIVGLLSGWWAITGGMGGQNYAGWYGSAVTGSADAGPWLRARVAISGLLALNKSQAIYLTRNGQLPDRDWIIAQLRQCEASPVELLAGRPAKPAPDRGALVCVCFDVGTVAITAAAVAGAATVEAVGQATCAGTNCGSCRPAIARLLEAALTLEAEAAE